MAAPGLSASLRDVHRKDYQLTVLAQQASGWYMDTGERRYNATILARYSELVPGLVFYTLKFCMVLGGRPHRPAQKRNRAMPETVKSRSAAGYALTSRLSIATKLYSVFALFALLTAAITVLSDYNSRRNAELTEAIETASRSALNVERVNSLVYAVVMESRGIYMSTEAAVVKKYGDGLVKFNDQILAVVKDWESIVRADDAQQFAVFKKRIEQFVDFRKELVRRGIEIGAAAGREWGDNDANRAVRSALNKDLEALSRVYVERSKEIGRQTDLNRSMSFVLTGLGGLALILVCIGVL